MKPQSGDIWGFEDLDGEAFHYLLLEEFHLSSEEWSFKAIRLDTGQQDEAYFKKPSCNGWRKIV